MRILRIVLRNFRGVTLREVQLPPAGVTVVEGPNEVGKSSLAEAVDLLFEEPDGSTKQRVKAVKPVDADVGAEVEAEFTVGPYHLVYRKRWHRRPETVLRVLAPHVEHCTGRPAHDRVNEILDETIDRALWKALRYQQGIGIDQAALGDSLSLLTALDAAAAGGGFGDQAEAEDLWSRVGEEYRRYHTATGRPIAERNELAKRVQESREEVTRLAAELAEIEEAAEQHHRLDLELARLTNRAADQEKQVDELSARWSRLQAEQQQVEALALATERAAHLAERAASAHRQRRDLVEAGQAAAREAAGLSEQVELAAPGLQAAGAAMEHAQRRREEGRQAQRAAEQAEALARADLEYHRDLFSMQAMGERRDRAEQAQQQRGEAEAFLESCRLDESRLAEIEQAHLDWVAAQAGLRAESPSVRVEALAPIELEVDGREQPLAAGEVMEESVAGRLQVVLPGRVRMTVTGGARIREAEEQVAAAREHLQYLYAAAGVSGEDPLAAARDLDRRRRAARQARDQADQVLTDSLRDLTLPLLTDKIDRARERTRQHLAERPPEPPLPPSREEAETAMEAAVARRREAGEAAEQREGELELARDSLRRADDAVREREFRRQAAQEQAHMVEEQLAEARKAAGDEQLAAALAAAQTAAETAAAAHYRAAEQLAAQNPDQVKARADNARAVLDRLRQERREVELALTRVRSVLDVRGEAGLHDQLDRAQSELLHLERRREHGERRATAADLLYQTLRRHRDAAKRAYVAPFREQLERFGRVVFDGELSIELDHEDLRVVSRTLDGVTVPWESLSMGAREQLSLLSRLACAVLVARPDAGDGGVPVIIDDALGNSDPARLERLGAVLALAGRESQVIVLTCTPDRYRCVGSATVIRLGAGGVGEEPPAAEQPAGEPIREEPAAEERPGEAAVLACLREAGIPLGKAEIVARSGLPERQWSATITALVEQGRVVREGERRGARYRLAEG